MKYSETNLIKTYNRIQTGVFGAFLRNPIETCFKHQIWHKHASKSQCVFVTMHMKSRRQVQNLNEYNFASKQGFLIKSPYIENKIFVL